MADSLRTDYDRMVGESYKDYAARCRGRMLAAEHERDVVAAQMIELDTQLVAQRHAADERGRELRQLRTVGHRILALHRSGDVRLLDEDGAELARALGEQP